MGFYLSNDDEDEEETKGGVSLHPFDQQVEKMLLKKRRVLLFSQVNDQSSKEVIRKLWYLEEKDPGKPILFVINSPGGAVDSGFAIWDQIKMISSPVTTLVTGLAASMGSVLSLVAPKDRRFATKNSRIMIHQPLISGVIQGQATDLEIQAKEIIKTRELLIDLYCSETGQERKVIEKALDRDKWMSAAEAIEFGLLTKTVENYKEIGFE